MLTLNRRKAIAISVASLLTQSGVASRLAAAPADVDADTLSAYVDVLLPADAYSPQASEFGVSDELRELAMPVPLFLKLLALGTNWLNATGQGPFHTLSKGDQNKVVAWMSTSDVDRIPGRFYQLVRLTAVEIYYSRPEVINGFPLNSAPQPLGYPPPWQ